MPANNSANTSFRVINHVLNPQTHDIFGWSWQEIFARGRALRFVLSGQDTPWDPYVAADFAAANMNHNSRRRAQWALMALGRLACVSRDWRDEVAQPWHVTQLVDGLVNTPLRGWALARDPLEAPSLLPTFGGALH